MTGKDDDCDGTLEDSGNRSGTVTKEGGEKREEGESGLGVAKKCLSHEMESEYPRSTTIQW
jgi:hypothetical protein